MYIFANELTGPSSCGGCMVKVTSLDQTRHAARPGFRSNIPPCSYQHRDISGGSQFHKLLVFVQVISSADVVWRVQRQPTQTRTKIQSTMIASPSISMPFGCRFRQRAINHPCGYVCRRWQAEANRNGNPHYGSVLVRKTILRRYRDCFEGGQDPPANG